MTMPPTRPDLEFIVLAGTVVSGFVATGPYIGARAAATAAGLIEDEAKVQAYVLPLLPNARAVVRMERSRRGETDA